MIPEKLSTITADHIRALVSDEVHERRDLDFKEKLPPRDDGKREEFIADVCAFANSGGGDIVYGIEDKKDEHGRPMGVAGSIVGLVRVNPDHELASLLQLLEQYLKPKVFGIDFAHIEGLGEGPVVVLRIPPSFNGPHVSTFKGQHRFYTRVASQKRLLDVDEIRSAFLASESASDRLRDFRAKRLADISADELPVPLFDQSGRLVVHMVPASGAANRAPAIDPRDVKDLVYPPAQGGQYGGHHFNVDGIVGYQSSGGAVRDSYLQVFRSGALEFVYVDTVYRTNDALALAHDRIDMLIRSSLEHGLKVLRRLDRSPPYVLMATVLGVHGVVISNGWPDPAIRHLRYNRRELLLPDVWIQDDTPNFDDVVRPMMDVMWQACGHPRCASYDEAGRRRAREG